MLFCSFYIFTGELPGYSGLLSFFSGELFREKWKLPDFPGELPDFCRRLLNMYGRFLVLFSQLSRENRELLNISGEFPDFQGRLPEMSGGFAFYC
ncbi:hypothetical protein SAMN05421788_101395 [Filimonas lacunae]|uniref:Uncharacterized protein n=1 Tax=Filimonas lacunae TaxID=477680 RepID=A0A1N7KSB0_9BACT|nr:hypothetical protein SAMN05421788_101395 [Filimonas lacunae]